MHVSVYGHASVILRFSIFSILPTLPNLRVLLHVYEHMHTYVSVGSCFLWECLACARLVFFSGPASRAAIEAGEGGGVTWQGTASSHGAAAGRSKVLGSCL